MRCAAHQPCYITCNPPPHAETSAISLIVEYAAVELPETPSVTVCGTLRKGSWHSLVSATAEAPLSAGDVITCVRRGPSGGSVSPPPGPLPVPFSQTTKRVSCGPGFRATQGRELCVTSRLPAAWNLRPNDSYWDHYWPFLCLCNGISQRYSSRMIER